MKPRDDDFETRRQKLKALSDEELKKRFFTLTDQLIDPLLKLAHTHTSPSIERSVLLRMGFSSLEAKDIVHRLSEHHLLAKGAGHAVYAMHRYLNIPLREAGLAILNPDGIDKIKEAYHHVKTQ